MDTLILRIAEPDGDAFPITLWEVADGNPQGDRPCASASLPLELPGGDAMAPERLRQDLLGEPGPSRRFSEIGDHLLTIEVRGAAPLCFSSWRADGLQRVGAAVQALIDGSG